MGKGDIKSRRGKLFAGSFGVRRQKKDKKAVSGLVKTKEAVSVIEKPKKTTVEPKKTVPKKVAKPKKETQEKDTAAE